MRGFVVLFSLYPPSSSDHLPFLRRLALYNIVADFCSEVQVGISRMLRLCDVLPLGAAGLDVVSASALRLVCRGAAVRMRSPTGALISNGSTVFGYCCFSGTSVTMIATIQVVAGQL